LPEEALSVLHAIFTESLLTLVTSGAFVNCTFDSDLFIVWAEYAAPGAMASATPKVSSFKFRIVFSFNGLQQNQDATIQTVQEEVGTKHKIGSDVLAI
jgi:hypothetical protein